MGVNFRGVQVFMSQDLLDGFHIHAILQHQRGRRVAKLMRGILGTVQTGLGQMLFHQCMNIGAADPLISGGQEQRILVPAADWTAHSQIPFQSGFTGIIQCLIVI